MPLFPSFYEETAGWRVESSGSQRTLCSWQEVTHPSQPRKGMTWGVDPRQPSVCMRGGWHSVPGHQGDWLVYAPLWAWEEIGGERQDRPENYFSISHESAEGDRERIAAQGVGGGLCWWQELGGHRRGKPGPEDGRGHLPMSGSRGSGQARAECGKRVIIKFNTTLKF